MAISYDLDDRLDLTYVILHHSPLFVAKFRLKFLSASLVFLNLALKLSLFGLFFFIA